MNRGAEERADELTPVAVGQKLKAACADLNAPTPKSNPNFGRKP